MKKRYLTIGLIVFVMVAASLAFAQVWHTANQATIGWDAVTTIEGGAPLPAGDTIEYVVYLSNAITDPGKDNPVEVATLTDLTQLITLNTEGRYFVGVKAVRKIQDGTEVGESEVSWSDNPQVVLNGDTFGLRYFLPPSGPVNVRPIQEPIG